MHLITMFLEDEMKFKLLLIVGALMANWAQAADEAKLALLLVDSARFKVECEAYAGDYSIGKAKMRVHIGKYLHGMPAGGQSVYFHSDTGLGELVSKVKGAAYSETLDPKASTQTYYSAFFEDNGREVESPIYGKGKRNIESLSPHKDEFKAKLESICKAAEGKMILNQLQATNKPSEGPQCNPRGSDSFCQGRHIDESCENYYGEIGTCTGTGVKDPFSGLEGCKCQ
jgi:hypothetical protein